MSNHSSNKRIILHHQQVNQAVWRKFQRRLFRLIEYQEQSYRLRNAYNELCDMITERMAWMWYAMVLGIILAGGWIV